VLAASHTIERYPSTSWLATARARRPEGKMGRVLAMAGPSEEDGAPSARAATEVEDLRSRYQGVDVGTAEHSDAVTPERLTDYGLLHLVTRARLDDHHPWYSGILLERARTDHDPYWRAATIGTAELDARLVVLPACEPARGDRLPDIGAQALATALLAAGAEAVVVNLWPAGGRQATRWTDDFYARLASGATVAEAMASADQGLRLDPATRAPQYWAGHALFGNGDVRVPLQGRPRWWWPSIAGAGVIVAAIALVIGARRRHVRERAVEALA